MAMTNQEAIDIIKVAIAEVEWEYPMDYAAAFDMAVKALEKQEPIAPEVYTVVVSQYGYAEHTGYRCGVCKCGLIRNTNWRQKYCPACGRPVKWND